MTVRRLRVARVAACVAAVLGTASAMVSAYWALGGTGLLDTVGGEIERWGRQRSVGVIALLWVVVAAKLVGAIVPLAFAGVGVDRPPRWATMRAVRVIGWIVAGGLTLYGTLLTVAGLLVELGVIDPAADADRHAIAWHAYLWDPWFAAWGVALAIVMVFTSPGARRAG